MRDFRLPPPSRRDLRSSGILRIVECYFCTDTSGRHIGPIIKGQEVKKSPWISWPLEMGPLCCPETSVQKYHSTLRNVPEERRSDDMYSGRDLRTFRRDVLPLSLPSTLRMEAVYSFATPVKFHQTTRRHILATVTFRVTALKTSIFLYVCYECISTEDSGNKR